MHNNNERDGENDDCNDDEKDSMSIITGSLT